MSNYYNTSHNEAGSELQGSILCGILGGVIGMIGFFLTRRSLLAYADWKRGPWHIAYAGGNGYSYNLLPEKLPNVNPPAYFAVHSRFASGTQVIVEGSRLRWRRRMAVMYSMIRIIRYWLSLQAVWNTQT